MVRNGEIPLADIKRALRKHWWIIPVSLIGCTALAVALTYVLPKKYTSATVILVEEPGVPSEYVKPLTSESINQQLSTMQDKMVSRSQLLAVIDKLGLYPGQRQPGRVEELLGSLRKAITVKPVDRMPGTASNTAQIPGFNVEVKWTDPQTAHDICTEVTSIFLEQDANLRELIAKGTNDFLNKQLIQAKQKLDEQDAALAKFQSEHWGNTPDREATNLSLLTGTNSQLEAAAQSIAALERDKAFNQTMLDAQLTSWQQSLKGVQDPDVQQQQLLDMEKQLSDLLFRYTPQHPDVVKMKAEIADLKKRMAENPGTDNSTASRREPLQIQQLRARIRQDDEQIAEATKKQERVQAQVNMLQARVQSTPAIEQEYKQLTRNHDTALEEYKDLLRKSGSATEATELQHQQEGQRYSVLDPPTLPTEPSFPNKLYFTLGGIGLGFAASAGLLYLFALADKSMHTERDVELCLKLPVLTTVPSLDLLAIKKIKVPQTSHDSAVVFKA